MTRVRQAGPFLVEHFTWLLCLTLIAAFIAAVPAFRRLAAARG